MRFLAGAPQPGTIHYSCTSPVDAASCLAFLSPSCVIGELCVFHGQLSAGKPPPERCAPEKPQQKRIKPVSCCSLPWLQQLQQQMRVLLLEEHQAFGTQ